MKLRIFSFIAAISVLWASPTALAWTLAWDANPTGHNVVSYRIYERIGTIYNYLGTTTVSPTPSYLLPALSNGTHAFVVTALNTYGESFYSNEVAVTVGVPTPTPTPTPTPLPLPPGTFFRGINVNGNAVTINGNSWLSHTNAVAQGFSTANQTFRNPRLYSPFVDDDTNTMVGEGIWCSGCDVNFSQVVSNGSYDIYLWMIEDYQSNYRSSNAIVQGAQLASGIGRMPLNTWQRYGPYPATVTNGVLSVRLARVAGDPLVQGVEIWTMGSATPTPIPSATPAPSPTPIPSATQSPTASPTPAPPPLQVSQLVKDGTKCSQISDGTGQQQNSVAYGVDGNGKINSTNPAKFMYWVKIDAPAGDNIFVLRQSVTTGNFNYQCKLDSGNQVAKADCKAVGGAQFVQDTTSGANSAVTITFNAPSAGTYYIGLKFKADSLKGLVAPTPATTIGYSFSINGVLGSTNALSFIKQ